MVVQDCFKIEIKDKIHFVAYGNERFKNSIQRIENEAKKFDIFEKIWIFREDDLKKDHSFWKKHENFIQNNKRGGGYWIWKPYLVLKVMNSVKDGEIILYCDSGCTLDSKYQKKILNYVQQMKNHGSTQLAFIQGEAEARRTKMDLLRRMNYDETEVQLSSPQLMATVFFIVNNRENRELVKKWYELSIENNYHFVDDTSSILPNDRRYVEHRHDQSIGSILRKRQTDVLKKSESELGENEKKSPIRITRLKL